MAFSADFHTRSKCHLIVYELLSLCVGLFCRMWVWLSVCGLAVVWVKYKSACVLGYEFFVVSIVRLTDRKRKLACWFPGVCWCFLFVRLTFLRLLLVWCDEYWIFCGLILLIWYFVYYIIISKELSNNFSIFPNGYLSCKLDYYNRSDKLLKLSRVLAACSTIYLKKLF